MRPGHNGAVRGASWASRPQAALAHGRIFLRWRVEASFREYKERCNLEWASKLGGARRGDARRELCIVSFASQSVFFLFLLPLFLSPLSSSKLTAH